MGNRDQAKTRPALAGSVLPVLPLLAGLGALAAPASLPFDPALTERAIVGYAALLLSFYGGMCWGIRAEPKTGGKANYRFGALAPLLGLVTLLLPFGPALALLIVGFAALGAWDAWSGQRRSVPASFAYRRVAGTLLFCLVLIAILFARALLGG